MISEKIVERAVSGKGVGVVAVAEIAAGELLVAEQPLLVMEHWSPDHLLAAWTKLPRASQVFRILLSRIVHFVWRRVLQF